MLCYVVLYYYVMLDYIMLLCCHIGLCYVIMLCYFMLGYVMLCYYVTLCYVLFPFSREKPHRMSRILTQEDESKTGNNGRKHYPNLSSYKSSLETVEKEYYPRE